MRSGSWQGSSWAGSVPGPSPGLHVAMFSYSPHCPLSAHVCLISLSSQETSHVDIGVLWSTCDHGRGEQATWGLLNDVDDSGNYPMIKTQSPHGFQWVMKWSGPQTLLPCV